VAKLITIRVYEELNDFIHYSRRKKAFSFPFTGKRTVKDIVESIGIPHTEVDLILANGNPVTFSYYPGPGDYLSVYPVFESLDIGTVTRLRPEPLRETRFILDVHLGTLARYLRMTGFDCVYRNNLEDNEIIHIALEQKRIILTRDLPLLKNGKVTHGYFVRSTNPLKQLHEIVGRFDLGKKLDPFSRCMECNGQLEKTDREAVKNKVRPKTLLYIEEYYRCQSCGKVYWKGSHHRRMEQMIGGLGD
jgi:uncharacterized protein with PIN domain